MLRLSEVPQERPVSLRHAADRVAEFIGRRVHDETIRRWATRGVRGVKLETVVVAGSRVTTHDAIERFIAATTAAANGRLKGGRS